MVWSTTSKVALTAAFIAAVAGTALAVDSGAPAAHRGSWAGPYVGSHLGWTRQNVDISTAAASASYDADGSAGGVLAGWMLQSGRIAYGIEGDITIQETKAEIAGPFAGGIGSDFTWNYSLRARAGVDMGRFLPFLTAGISFADMHSKNLQPFTFFGDAQTHVGWTAGVGIDVKIWQPQIIRIEYLYANYGSENYTFAGTVFTNEFDTHTLRGALIVQLDGNDKVTTPWFSGTGRWAGHYGGLVAGWTGSWADVQGPGPAGPTFSYTMNGVGIGVVAGTAWQWDWFVVGFDNDLVILTTDGANGASPISSEFLWYSHNRVRVGVDLGRFMPFVAGGLAITQQEHRRPGFAETDLSPKWGLSLGLGVDYAVDDRVTARLEYLHDDFQDIEVVFADGFRSLDSPTETVRFGITYRAGP